MIAHPQPNTSNQILSLLILSELMAPFPVCSLADVHVVSGLKSGVPRRHVFNNFTFVF